MFVDTHCHIHDATYPLDPQGVMERARQAGVEKMICVGTSEKASNEAVAFARSNPTAVAAVGVHPHESKDGWANISTLVTEEVVAVGEIGLDYFYTHSPREVQIKAFEAQIQIALDHNLPVIFHVREAFDDFWPIFDNFHGVRGVLHSFTDTFENARQAMQRNLYIGVNGISTFTKDEVQKSMFSLIPLEKLLLETDAPFLTPQPFRGRVNEPAFVKNVAAYHAAIRGVSLDQVATATTINAHALFAL